MSIMAATRWIRSMISSTTKMDRKMVARLPALALAREAREEAVAASSCSCKEMRCVGVDDEKG